MQDNVEKTPQTRLVSTLTYIVEKIGTVVLTIGRSIVEYFIFNIEIFRQMIRGPFRPGLIFQQLEFIGNQSLNIILLTAFFTGAVFGLNIGGIFQIFKAEGIMGAATAKSLAKELSPMMVGFLTGGRAGSGMTAEIATMKVSEQVEAMEAMGVDPVNYLVVPRVIAAILILPFLYGIFTFIGVIGSFVIGVWLFDVDQGVFIEKITWMVVPSDLLHGIEKTAVFAFVIASIACLFGLKASGGAEGVGMATTTSVVITLLALLIFDFIITYFQIAF